MPQTPMPLPETDYRVMNTSPNEFFEITEQLPQDTQYYVINATHRLAEVDWITRKLEEQIRTKGAPVVQEGLLSLQLYLLLTCADTLGHIYSTGGVGKRFREFFDKLPQEAEQNLIDNILTWKTDFAELVRLGLGDARTNTAFYPSRQQILQAIQPLTPDKRLEAVVDFLYFRRNYYTHQSEYPQLGYHPNLSVMQGQRLNVPNTATLGEPDRLQPMFEDTYAFSIREDFAKLDAGQLTTSLRKRFEKNSIVLTSQAQVQEVRPGNQWAIVDASKRYVIRNENGKLNVYIPNIYFTFYETNDAIATIRWSVVRGLGKIIGRV